MQGARKEEVFIFKLHESHSPVFIGNAHRIKGRERGNNTYKGRQDLEIQRSGLKKDQQKGFLFT